MPDNSEKHAVSVRDRLTQPKLERYWWLPIAVAGMVPAVLVSWLILHNNGYDPTIFLRVGIGGPRQATEISDILGRPIPVVGGYGHDGKFFFFQAMDPLLFNPDGPASFLGRPIYRSQRIAYPFIASGGGIVPATWLPWTLLLTNIVTFSVGSVATARLAMNRGGSRWVGLVFAVNLAAIVELGVGSGGVVALAAAAVGIAYLDQERVAPAVVSLAVSALAREAMVLFAFGVALARWRSTGKLPLPFLWVPASVVTWGWYVRWRIDEGSGADEVIELSLPFVGFFEAAQRWSFEPENSINLVVALCLGMAASIVIRRSHTTPDPLAWGATATALMLPFFGPGRLAAVLRHLTGRGDRLVGCVGDWA